MCCRSEQSLRFLSLTWVMLFPKAPVGVRRTHFLRLLDSRPQFFTGSWPEVSLSSLPRGLFRWAVSFTRASEQEGKRVCRQDGSHGPWFPIPFAISCSLDSSHLVQPTLQERSCTPGHESQEVAGIQGHLRKLPATATKTQTLMPFHNPTNE